MDVQSAIGAKNPRVKGHAGGEEKQEEDVEDGEKGRKGKGKRGRCRLG